MIKLIVFMLAFSLASSVCIMLAINTDAKANNIKSRSNWVIFAFFFSIITGIIYLLCRKSLIKKAPYYCTKCSTVTPKGAVCPQCGHAELIQINNTSKKSKTVFALFMTLGFVIAVSGNVFMNYTDFGLDELIPDGCWNYPGETYEHIAYSPENADDISYYYDRNAKAYVDNYEVPYYTESGECYLYEYRDDGEGLINNDTGEFHKSEECFVNESGYLVFDETLYSLMNDYDYKSEKDDNTYCLAAYVSWDNMGNTVDKNGNIVENW